MQNAFPLPVAAISQGESTTGDARKTERGTKLDEPGTGRFESFLVACAQPEAGQSGVGDSPSDLPFPSLTLPVLQDVETEEPLAQTGDMPLFSRSISAPVTFAKDEERGTGRLSEQKAMEEIFPDPDMERLRSLLSRMQDRYAASLRGDGHEAVSVEADKPDENAASGDSSDVRPEGSGVEPEVRKTQDVSGEEKKASIHAGSILSTLSRVHGIRFDASVTEGSGAEEEDRVSSPVSSYPENDVSRFPQETTPEETMERLRSMLSRTQERHEAFLLNEKLQGEKPGYGDISVEAEKVTETDKVTEADKADENAAPAVFWGVYPEDGGVGPDRDREISDVSGEEKKASIHAGSILSTLSFDAAEKGNPDMRLDIEEGVASPVSLYPGNDVSQKTSERLSERKPEKISGRTSPAGIPREGERAEKASSVVEAEGPVVSAAGGRAEGGGQAANGETSGGGKDSRGQADRGDLSDRDAGRPAVAGADKETEKPVANRRTSAFEQFFDDVMTRRGEARTGALELPSSKGSPLSGQAALREGLDNVVRFIRANGEQKAALIVDPPALGRVSVELTSTATGLDASIKVSSEQIRQLVQDQIVQLRTSLAQQGVELAHFSVDVQQENSRRHQDTEQQKSRTRGITGKEDPDDGQDGQTVFRVDLTQGLLWWVG